MEMCAHEYELTDPELYTKSVPLKIHRNSDKFNGINMKNNKGMKIMVLMSTSIMVYILLIHGNYCTNLNVEFVHVRVIMH